ncbi:unnamed protein product, partial [Effrenium voratum]
YQKAQAILFGEGLDVSARFNVDNDEKGQILLEKIFSVYQEGPKRTIPWFKDNERCIKRHPLNQRRTGAITRQYMTKILDAGLVEGVRGEAWFQHDPDKEGHFLA